MPANATLILRLLALTALLVLSGVALTVSVQLAQKALGTPPLYVLMGLAISSASLLVLLPVFLLQLIRPACVPFLVWLEMLWTFLLGGAWLSLAIKLSLLQDEDNSLSSFKDNPYVAARYTALQDAVFLSWALLWSWSLWITILALRAWRKGQSCVWSCPTRQVKFLEIKPVLIIDPAQEKFARSSSVLASPISA
ncbi:hypothetical protein EXIGLDRAFT_716805 [Exidia glandulosa HHB12029]|uniref:Uncharacterized protein n=1 Tax=Exidia glandulosa HHB12029 TaxID=1314781 RepID=A0A165IPN0_EXIGL|nr:hypothetical protein EXIGLDRAFT_716805 [Exidia glandulosa HHB12029]